MLMTSSPVMHAPVPTHHSHPHSPLNLSPAGSPSLKPLSSMMPPVSGTPTPLKTLPGPATSSPAASSSSAAQRSYARAPTVRPYQPLLVGRANSGGSFGTPKEVAGDTKEFGEMVAHLVETRTRAARAGDRLNEGDEIAEGNGASETFDARKAKSLGGSLAGSWENERAELIVDVPVWSPGCFKDLSTLHALRDNTLSHTHSILSYLLRQHSIPASYRLLARSAVQPQTHVGWGCIRLAPSVTAHGPAHSPLKPKFRRSSFVHESTSPKSKLLHPQPIRPILSSKASSPVVVTTPIPVTLKSGDRAIHTRMSPIERMEQAVADDSDSEEEAESPVGVLLREGYRSGSVSDEEDEDECADVIVAREVEKRGAKEGDVFVMTLFGGPALILC